MSNRIGSFEMHREFLYDWERLNLCLMFGNFVVVHAQADWAKDTVCYVAYSPLFEEVPDNTAAPEYDIICDSNTIPATIKAVKIRN